MNAIKDYGLALIEIVAFTLLFGTLTGIAVIFLVMGAI